MNKKQKMKDLKIYLKNKIQNTIEFYIYYKIFNLFLREERLEIKLQNHHVKMARICDQYMHINFNNKSLKRQYKFLKDDTAYKVGSDATINSLLIQAETVDNLELIDKLKELI